MTDKAAPSLEYLSSLQSPAWLWDGGRMRVVWANSAGIGFFGCKSLFDLIDTPFDEQDPGIARVKELAADVRKNESWREVISFASAISTQPFSVDLYAHTLSDGRSGLMMVSVDDVAQSHGNSAHGETATGNGTLVLETLPAAVIVCAGDGRVLQANAAARDIWNGTAPATLDTVCGEQTGSTLLERAGRAGVATITGELQTGFGKREFKLLARHLPDGPEPDSYSILLEDITDRRALEQLAKTPAPKAAAAKATSTQADAPAAGAAPAATSEAAQKDDASARLSEIRQAIEAANGDAPAGKNAVREPAGEKASARESHESRPQAFNVAPIVRKALSGVAKAVVLHRGGKLIYANTSAAKLLGGNSEEELAGRHDIAAAIGALEGSSGYVRIDGIDGGAVTARAAKSTFPWNDGVMPLAVLSLAEEQDQVMEPADGRAERSGKNGAAPDEPPLADEAATDNGATEPEADDGRPDVQVFEDPAAIPEMGPASKPALTQALPEVSTQADATARAAAAPASLSELVSILDTASDGVVFLSDSGTITHLSAGAEALFGVRAASVLDKPLSDLLDKSSGKTVREYFAALGGNGVSSLFNSGREVTALMQDGGEVPVFLSMHKLAKDIAGIPPSDFCAVLRDMSQWKKTEGELREARDKAEHSSKRKSEFLARMSHELRTPLNAILGFSDVMRKGEFGELGNERYEGYANDIHTSGQYLLSLVNDLLDLSKVEAGKLELNFTSVDLGAIIDGCIQLMQNEATGARVVMRKSIADKLPNVVADQRSVKQVILNLISNAVKFTEPGGQVIIAAKGASNGELVLSVADTGVGMSEDELTSALEPFSRIETVGREVQGTGLGLPLTKALVEANRARFAISSEPRKGTRIDITFPTTRVLAS